MPELTGVQRGWRRFRRLPAATQAGITLVVLGGYTALLVALIGGGDDGPKTRTVVQTQGAAKRPLSPLERQVSAAVRNAKLFQREQTDIPQFRRPRIASVHCRDQRCTVIYALAVPGRGRILFQQLEMARAVFGGTDVTRLSLRVVRSLPTGPAASPKAEEETAPGLPLTETTCDRSRLPKQPNWDSQKEAQALLFESCSVRTFDQGVLHGRPSGSSSNPQRPPSADTGQGSGQPGQ